MSVARSGFKTKITRYSHAVDVAGLDPELVVPVLIIGPAPALGQRHCSLVGVDVLEVPSAQVLWEGYTVVRCGTGQVQRTDRLQDNPYTIPLTQVP